MGSRRLQVRWMIAGYGGYEEKRLEIPWPFPPMRVLLTLAMYGLYGALIGLAVNFLIGWLAGGHAAS